MNAKDQEIAKAILEWLQSKNLTSSYSALLAETAFTDADVPTSKKLESKWTAILLMQKKITDLQQEVESLKEQTLTSATGIAKPTFSSKVVAA